MSNVLMSPKLRGKMSEAMMNDLTTVLWAYVNLRLMENPVDLDEVRLTPEASALFASKFGSP
jgi:hypothetical protein